MRDCCLRITLFTFCVSFTAEVALKLLWVCERCSPWLVFPIQRKVDSSFFGNYFRKAYLNLIYLNDLFKGLKRSLNCHPIQLYTKQKRKEKKNTDWYPVCSAWYLASQVWGYVKYFWFNIIFLYFMRSFIIIIFFTVIIIIIIFYGRHKYNRLTI